MAKEILAGQHGSTPTPPVAARTTAPPIEKPPVVIELRQFRKLPVIIKAFQWFPELGEVGGVVYKVPAGQGVLDARPVVETLEGDHNVKSSDWIITGVKGEKYPCDDSIFRMTYEEAKETEVADPTKLPEVSERNITWLVVRFSNGDSFRIAAKFIARRMIELIPDTDYLKVMRMPLALVKFASENMGWNELTQVAQGFQSPQAPDRPIEWATAYKTVEIEPEPKPERITKPVPASENYKTAKQEDAEQAANPKKKTDDDDPEEWQD